MNAETAARLRAETLAHEAKYPKGARGFASMDKQKRAEIAAKGGRTAHARGVAHRWDSDAALVAGRRGGMKVSADREHMARIGRMGGKTRGERMRAQRAAPETPVDGEGNV